jgi:UDP-GlcNAc:undecaprenyl-phosphate GlcNAc-1-phosphate transferase
MSLPVVTACQIGALWLGGKYRQVWGSFGSSELVSIARGIVMGVSGSVILLVFLYRFEGFSRAVFLIDGVVLLFLLVGSRVAITSIDDYLRSGRTRGRRVLIYGAGGAGALLLRELLQNRALELTPVGFLDDDRRRHRLKLDGVTVVGGIEDLPGLVRRLGVEEVLVAVRDLPAAQMTRLLEICREQRVQVRRMRFALDEVDLSGRPTIHVVHHGR